MCRCICTPGAACMCSVEIDTGWCTEAIGDNACGSILGLPVFECEVRQQHVHAAFSRRTGRRSTLIGITIPSQHLTLWESLPCCKT